EQKKVFFYPGVAPMVPSPTIYALEEKVQSPWKARTPKARSTVRDLEISVLKTHEKTHERRGEATGQRSPQKDLTIDVYGLLEGAVAVAMSRIVRGVEEKQSKIARAAEENQAAPPPLEPWEQVLIALGEKRDRLKHANMVPVGEATTFEGVASELERSFCTIIDVSDDDAVGCFWLGYCHARGLDAIPFDRTPAAASDGTAAPPTGGTNESERPLKRLAFDIRALWYMEHNDSNAVALKAEIGDILTRLLERDLPDRQRRAFWDRFPRETDLKILTGAIHVKELNREMVGDWDVRTVSELVSHLSQVREPSSIKLATPLYSPEHAFTKSKLEKGKFLTDFYGDIDGELKDCSAVVIASADVNPVTEYLLHQVYGLGEPKVPKDAVESEVPEDAWEAKLCGYVAMKYLTPDEANAPGANKTDFPRRFSKEQKAEDGQKPRRGFIEYSNGRDVEPLLEEYKSQAEPGKFQLLGHLLIAKWPVQGQSQPGDHPQKGSGEGQLIVLLNGVSGPATSALAEILTGGGPKATPEMMAQAEAMLRDLNQQLDEPKWDVVEAIIKMEVDSSQGAGGNQYRDSREVKSWQYEIGPKISLRRPVRESEPKTGAVPTT
ncbi:MAG: hypothetical protein WCP21_11905, partial [Armatimonadota bacterium]